MTGVEQSEVWVRIARPHAAAAGLNIGYRVGVGEWLPVGENAFDVVYCCDVLEHVNCEFDQEAGGGAITIGPVGRSHTSHAT